MKIRLLTTIIIFIPLFVFGQKWHNIDDIISIEHKDSVHNVFVKGKYTNNFKVLLDFPNLTHLSISDCTFLSITFGNELSKLESLEIENCVFIRFDNLSKTCPNLKKLVIRNCNLKYLPEDYFYNFNYLNDLDLSFNKLSNLPTSLYDLENLSNLNISGNVDLKIDFQLLKSKSILRLIADLCGFNQLNIDSSFSKLNYLSLRGNKFNNIKSLNLNIPQLKYLDLSNCELTSLKHQNINCNKIHIIILSHNYLSEFVISDFSFRPSEIILNNNRLKFIDSLGLFDRLKYLNLACNEIQALDFHGSVHTSLNIAFNPILDKRPIYFYSFRHVFIDQNLLNKLHLEKSENFVIVTNCFDE